MNYLYLLFLTILALFIIVFLIMNNDIFSISVIVCAVFLISTSFAIINEDRWNIIYSFKAYYMLVIGLLSFIVPEIIVKFFYDNSKSNKYSVLTKEQPIYVQNVKFHIIIIIESFVSLLYYRDLNRIASISGGNGSLGSVLKSLSYSSSLGADETLSPLVRILSRFNLIIAYVFMYIFLKNFNYLDKKDKLMRKNIRNLIPVIIYLLSSLLSGSRLQILLFIATALSSSYILKQRKMNWKIKVSYKYIKILLVALAIVLPSFYLALNILGRSAGNISMLGYLSIYIGGSIQHFNQYIQNPIIQSNIWGNETFNSIYQFLWKLGLYPEYISPHLEFRELFTIGTSGNMNYYGNVYTFFRSPLQDFGIFGMITTTSFISFVYSYFYYMKIKMNNATDVLILVYTYFLAQLTLVSIANQLTIVFSFYYIVNILLLVTGYWMIVKVKFKWI